MIKTIICWLWGHKILEKAYTGETYATKSYDGNDLSVSLYKWVRHPFCLRCGADVKPASVSDQPVDPQTER